MDPETSLFGSLVESWLGKMSRQALGELLEWLTQEIVQLVAAGEESVAASVGKRVNLQGSVVGGLATQRESKKVSYQSKLLLLDGS